MAVSAVRFLVENVSRLLEDNPSVISGAQKELRELMKDLDLLLMAEGEIETETLGERELINKAVYELEDTIDSCLTDAKGNSNLLRFLGRGAGHKMAKKLRELRQPIHAYLHRFLISDQLLKEKHKEKEGIIQKRIGESSHRQLNFRPSCKRDRVFVGFEDEEETIIGYLTEPQEELGVISIIGMRGLGKTSLARKIYENYGIVDEFPIRIWTHVSRCSNYREVSCDILRTFTDEDDDLSSESDKDINFMVLYHLKRVKFLLVLDGVRSVDDWKAVQNILPYGNDMSKVLITSCHDFNFGGHSHRLRFLNRDESWKLLQLQVFGTVQDCPPELEEIGQGIARKCGGLPLLIVLLGGGLTGQMMRTGSIKLEWQKIFENERVFWHYNKAVELAYSTLPRDLRESFLYLAVFPQGYEISVWTLIRLWIGEGFIPLPTEAGQNLEETAAQNLYHLIRRNLLMVGKTNPMGEVKTCQVHDIVHAFCTYKAREQNLFREIKSWSHEHDRLVSKRQLQASRRLCIHSDQVDKTLVVSQVTKSARVRSCICLYKKDKEVISDLVSGIFDALILLRVLDSQFNTFPTRMSELIHLRYITLYVHELKIVPKSLSELWNLQTLVVDTASRVIEMEANIWKLRDVKTNAAMVLSSKLEKGKGKGCENTLQTLHTLSPESCTEYVSERAHNVKALRVRGDLQSLFGKSSSFMENLVGLEKLKLVNDLYPYEVKAWQGPVPQRNCFPPYLKRLTLSNTSLTWNHMPTLATMTTLEVLKLKDRAFTGTYWGVGADCWFPRLQLLLVAHADLSVWEASTHSFPSLRCLVLKHCRFLNALPMALISLEELQLECVPSSVLHVAMNIADHKAKSGYPFKLSIASRY